MKFVSYAKYWHKIWSIRLVLLTLAYKGAIAAWQAAPTGWNPVLQPWEQWALWGIGGVLTSATGIAALLHQDSLKGDQA